MIQPRKPSLRISIVFFIVIRRLKLAAVLLCLPVLISCSTKPEQIAQEQLPSLGIKGGQEYKFSQGEVQVFRLIPQGEPSGEISLKAVQNGQVKQLNRFQFMHMWNDGGLAVKLTDTIELAFNVKCQFNRIRFRNQSTSRKGNMSRGRLWRLERQAGRRRAYILESNIPNRRKTIAIVNRFFYRGFCELDEETTDIEGICVDG